ncbi:MAG: sialidase family protein, partial [Ignavibacteriaceae bacterium]
MKENFTKFISLGLFALVLIFENFLSTNQTSYKNNQKEIKKYSEANESAEMKKERAEYYFRMLRDPKTNRIPPSIRHKELVFAEKLAEKNESINKISSNLTWKEAGPNDVGGRTRAIAVDVGNPNVVIAGGASGGIWKSTDNGASWNLKSDVNTILSVSSIAQDTRSGFTNIWYYGSGESQGSAGDQSGQARFSGNGIYKSTDNGETWQVLPNTLSSDVTTSDSPFDYVLGVVVSPVNGYIFVASDNYGIFRSADGGNSFTLVLGGQNEHTFSDVAVASNGNLLAVISDPGGTNTPGVYKSDNNGDSWTDITPNDYPQTSARGVLAFAPSNSDVAYLFLNAQAVSSTQDDLRFYKFNYSSGTSENRTNNLPDFTSANPKLFTQDSYDMVVAVKPDDENYVFVAGTSLFRSIDGFSTPYQNDKNNWIGGTLSNGGDYPNFHPDVHSFAFDPTDPNKMWWGHDGGLTYTSDITDTSYQTYFPWENKNNGYNVTQYYQIAIPDIAGDNRIMGGCQDNGTPYFTFDGNTTSKSVDVSSGDGAYAYFGNNFAYSSSQNGDVYRLVYDANNNPLSPFNGNNPYCDVKPNGAANQLFINPYVVDPNNEDVMYYPGGNVLWRNNQLSNIPDNENGTDVGWTKLDSITVPAGYIISALSVSKNPANILYYAGSSNGNDVPKIYKLTNSSMAMSGAVDISIAGAQAGAYIHDIAINPDNADEILVVMSNYNIIGLYHSADAGQSYTAVEGTLQGDQQNPGPSLRCATILPGNNVSTYFVATSIGLFSTTTFDGNN